MILISIWDGLGYYIHSPKTGFHDWGSSWLSSACVEECRDDTLSRQTPHPSRSFLIIIHILVFKVFIKYVDDEMSLNKLLKDYTKSHHHKPDTELDSSSIDGLVCRRFMARILVVLVNIHHASFHFLGIFL